MAPRCHIHLRWRFSKNWTINNIFFYLYFVFSSATISTDFRAVPAISGNWVIFSHQYSFKSDTKKHTHLDILYLSYPLKKNTTSKEHLWNMKTCCICNFTNTSSINFSKPYLDCFNISKASFLWWISLTSAISLPCTNILQTILFCFLTHGY